MFKTYDHKGLLLMDTSVHSRMLLVSILSIALLQCLFPMRVFAQGCDDCTKRVIAVYDIDVTVTKPSDPSAQADWLKLFEAGSGLYTTLIGNNPPDPCGITYNNLQLRVKNDGSVDPSPAGTYPVANLAPTGSTHTGDYILSGRLEKSEAVYILSLKLETAVSRKTVKTGLKAFGAENLASSAATDLVTQMFDVILDMVIENFENDLRTNNSDVAFKPEVIELRPAKANLKADETVDVEIKLLDCDEEPLKDRSISLRSGVVKGVTLPGSSGGEFVEESVVTDENGIAHATFKPTIQKGEAVMRCHWIGVKPSGDTVWTQGQQMVAVEAVPDFWKFTLTINNSVTFTRDTSSEYSSYHQVASGNGSVSMSGFFRNEADVDGVLQYYGGGDSIYWPQVSGSWMENERIQSEEYAQGVVVYAVERNDAISATAFLEGIIFEFSSDSATGFFFAQAGCRGQDQYQIMTFRDRKWTPYNDTSAYGEVIMAGWDMGEPGGSISRSGLGYSGMVTKNWTEHQPGPNGTAEVIYSQSMQVQIIPWYDNLTGIKGQEQGGDAVGLPMQTRLEQNYPNPFNPTTHIRYTVGRVEGPASGKVRLAVYDMLGREVAVLVDEKKAPGSYEVSFDSRGLASGVYIYRLASGSFVQSRVMVLVK